MGLNYGVYTDVVFFPKSVVMNNKRERGPGSGNTTGKPGNKMPQKPQGPGAHDQPKRNIRKTLFGRGNPNVSTEEKEKPKVWCSEEIQALIQYIALYWDGPASNGWPNAKDEHFWECCANGVAEATNFPKRSGKRVCAPFTFKLISYWRNVKDSSLQLNLAQATTTLHSSK